MSKSLAIKPIPVRLSFSQGAAVKRIARRSRLDDAKILRMSVTLFMELYGKDPQGVRELYMDYLKKDRTVARPGTTKQRKRGQ